jgi:hypothetical protein
METNKEFPNGFLSWQETYFEVVSYINQTVEILGSISNLAREEGGIGRLYELAENLTDEFEWQYEGIEWDGDYFDKIEIFLNKKEHGE